MREPGDELEAAREAWEAGNLAGLYTALVVCEQNDLPLPGWVHEGVATLWWEYLRGSQEGRRWLERWKKDQTRYEAWSEVQAGREAQAWARDELAGLRGLPPEPRIETLRRELRETMRRSRFTGQDEEDVYAEVAQALEEETGQRPASRTVRRHHATVARALERGEGLTRFYGGRLAKLRWRLLSRKE